MGRKCRLGFVSFGTGFCIICACLVCASMLAMAAQKAFTTMAIVSLGQAAAHWIAGLLAAILHPLGVEQPLLPALAGLVSSRPGAFKVPCPFVLAFLGATCCLLVRVELQLLGPNENAGRQVRKSVFSETMVSYVSCGEIHRLSCWKPAFCVYESCCPSGISRLVTWWLLMLCLF
jgi:hypothetical protein